MSETGAVAATPTTAPAPPLVVAHRGNASIAPGNTMPAVEGAWRAGADLVEIDVRLTADGVPVVIHDATLDATTSGTGEVAATTATQARELDAGSWFSPVFSTHRMPLLADVAAYLADHDGTDLLLEAKGDLSVVQATVVLATLEAAGMRDRTIVQTFWPQTIRSMRLVDPTIRLGLLVGSHVAPNEVMLPLSTEVRATACNPRYDLLAEDPSLLATIHDAGMKVFVWTLNEPRTWEQALAWGVDGIITDRPDRLAGWLSARGYERSAPTVV